MSDICKAPWNESQVESLNAFQHCGRCHPFTCGQRDPNGEHHVLRATSTGWGCPKCAAAGKEYTQDWCHRRMADWSWQDLQGAFCFAQLNPEQANEIES